MLGEIHDKLAVKREFWLAAEIRKTLMEATGCRVFWIGCYTAV
jgi:hypothetical protein